MAGEEINRDLRKARRERGLGPNAVCSFCGKADPLRLMKAKRFLEEHHPGGRANESSLTIILCRECHAVETARMLDANVVLGHDGRTAPEKLVAVLKAFAVFFESLANVLREWAQRLSDLVTALDGHAPGWRDLPEAKG